MTIVLELEQIERKRFNVLPILSTNEEFKGRDRMTKMQIFIWNDHWQIFLLVRSLFLFVIVRSIDV